MPQSAGATPQKPVPGYPRWAGWLSLGLFVVGCGSAWLSGVVGDVNQDKLAFVTGAAVFIPLGAMGMGMAYTARVQEALVRRIEGLEDRLRDRDGA